MRIRKKKLSRTKGTWIQITIKAPSRITILFSKIFYSNGIFWSTAYVSVANLLITLPILVFYSKNLIFFFMIVDKKVSKIDFADRKFPVAKLQERQKASTKNTKVKISKVKENELLIKKKGVCSTMDFKYKSK